MNEIICDFGSVESKLRLWEALKQCSGKMRIELTRYCKRRSDRQNRYYWPCFVAPFRDFLREQGEAATDLEAHEMLKSMFLKATKTLKGKKVDYVRSTTALSTPEFNEYLDQCAAFLASYCDIVVPDPGKYHEVA